VPELNKDQFYHGSDHEFEPGDELLSPAARGDLHGGAQMSVAPDRVFITNSRGEAGTWGKHVYRVEPHTDPTDTGYVGGSVKSPRRHFTAESATIVKRVSNPTLQRPQPVS